MNDIGMYTINKTCINSVQISRMKTVAISGGGFDFGVRGQNDHLGGDKLCL